MYRIVVDNFIDVVSTEKNDIWYWREYEILFQKIGKTTDIYYGWKIIGHGNDNGNFTRNLNPYEIKSLKKLGLNSKEELDSKEELEQVNWELNEKKKELKQVNWELTEKQEFEETLSFYPVIKLVRTEKDSIRYWPEHEIIFQNFGKPTNNIIVGGDWRIIWHGNNKGNFNRSLTPLEIKLFKKQGIIVDDTLISIKYSQN